MESQAGLSESDWVGIDDQVALNAMLYQRRAAVRLLHGSGGASAEGNVTLGGLSVQWRCVHDMLFPVGNSMGGSSVGRSLLSVWRPFAVHPVGVRKRLHSKRAWLICQGCWALHNTTRTLPATASCSAGAAACPTQPDSIVVLAGDRLDRPDRVECTTEMSLLRDKRASQAAWTPWGAALATGVESPDVEEGEPVDISTAGSVSVSVSMCTDYVHLRTISMRAVSTSCLRPSDQHASHTQGGRGMRGRKRRGMMEQRPPGGLLSLLERK